MNFLEYPKKTSKICITFYILLWFQKNENVTKDGSILEENIKAHVHEINTHVKVIWYDYIKLNKVDQIRIQIDRIKYQLNLTPNTGVVKSFLSRDSLSCTSSYIWDKIPELYLT